MKKLDIFKRKTEFDKFWVWFSEKELFIKDNLLVNTDEIAKLITDRIKVIHPDIAFEIPFKEVRGKRQFIVSADGIYDVFDEVIDLVDVAPKFEYFEIVAFRQKMDTDFESIEIEGLYLDYENIKFQYDLTDLPLDLDIYIEDYVEGDNRFIHAYFLLLDSLIGEFDAVTVIGETNFYVLPEESEELLDFIKLRDLVKELSIKS